MYCTKSSGITLYPRPDHSPLRHAAVGTALAFVLSKHDHYLHHNETPISCAKGAWLSELEQCAALVTLHMRKEMETTVPSWDSPTPLPVMALRLLVEYGYLYEEEADISMKANLTPEMVQQLAHNVSPVLVMELIKAYNPSPGFLSKFFKLE